jgi:diguanylate cyclase (GGDEF)-like protein
MKFSTTVNKYISSNKKFDSREIVRHQFFIYLILIQIIVSPILIILTVIFKPDIFFGLPLLIIVLCFSSVSLWIYNKNGTLNYCSNLSLIGLFLAALVASLSFLNAYGVQTYYYLGIPILAYFIAGLKSGASWTTISVLTAFVVLILKQQIVDLDVGIEGYSSQHAYFIERGIYLGSMVISGTCCYLYTYLYYRERKILLKQQAKLLRTINYDSLTGIYNSKKISTLAGGMIDSNVSQSFAYSFIGIDDFENINDQYGYPFGDKILKTLAYRLNKILPKNQILGRLYGTRFALLTMDPDDHEKTQKNIEELVADTWGVIEVDGKRVEINTSIGTAIYPDESSNLKQITTNADQRMLKQN